MTPLQPRSKIWSARHLVAFVVFLEHLKIHRRYETSSRSHFFSWIRLWTGVAYPLMSPGTRRNGYMRY